MSLHPLHHAHEWLQSMQGESHVIKKIAEMLMEVEIPFRWEISLHVTHVTARLCDLIASAPNVVVHVTTPCAATGTSCCFCLSACMLSPFVFSWARTSQRDRLSSSNEIFVSTLEFCRSNRVHFLETLNALAARVAGAPLPKEEEFTLHNKLIKRLPKVVWMPLLCSLASGGPLCFLNSCLWP